jgi:hypothetical protein
MQLTFPRRRYPCIVDAHDGQIWAESDGHDEETCPGSAFQVWLPLK